MMADTPPRIVLDTNVLYAGLYSASGKSHQLLRAIAERRVRIALSTPLQRQGFSPGVAVRY